MLLVCPAVSVNSSFDLVVTSSGSLLKGATAVPALHEVSRLRAFGSDPVTNLVDATRNS